MSRDDREHWNRRYAEGAFAGRTWPSALLAEWVPGLPTGRALDLACGAGRNALYLASHGFEVTGVDISSVGLERAAASASEASLEIVWREADLASDTLPFSGPFDLIVLFRYVNLPLTRQLPGLLAEGGVVIVEEHLASEAPDSLGPNNPSFRVERGDLRNALMASGVALEVLHETEGEIKDPDGRMFPLARIVARRPAADATAEIRPE